MLSVIIVTYQSAQRLDTLLQELSDLIIDGVIHDIVIIDNASSDETLAILRRWCSELASLVTVLSLTENLGFPRAVNIALKHTTGDLVAFLNPDLEGISQALRVCSDFLKQHPLVGACGPLLYGDHGIQVESARRIPGARSLALSLTGISRIEHYVSRTRLNRGGTITTEALCGAFFVTRRSLLHESEGFDERLFMYLEDVHYFQFLNKRARPVICLANLRVYHAQGASRAQVPGQSERDELDSLIGEVPWILAGDRHRRGEQRVIILLTFLMGLRYLIRGRWRTAASLLRWTFSSKPRYIGWRPTFVSRTPACR